MSAENCTLSTCSLDQAHLDYDPSLWGNAFFVGLFGLLAIFQFIFGLRYRTWGFMIGMVLGLIGEVIGYVGRVGMHYNPFTQTPFLTYIVALTIAPAFLSASIYLCLARLVVVYGEENSRFKPRTYTYVFMTCDLFALLLQAAGGALAAGSDSQSSTDTGVNIMVAGLAFQVVSLGIFMILALDFAWKVRKSGGQVVGTFAPVVASKMFKGFLIAIPVAIITIFIRSIYRVIELSDGFDSAIANNEVVFMILEGAMISIATIAITIFHPGLAFKGHWAEAGWSFKTSKDASSESQMKLKAQNKTENPYIGYFHRKEVAQDAPIRTDNHV